MMIVNFILAGFFLFLAIIIYFGQGVYVGSGCLQLPQC